MIRWLRRLAPEPESGRPRAPGAPDGVLYWDLKRFGRDQDDGTYYRADLRRRGYTVISLSDDIPAGDLAPVFEALLGWKAEQDLRDLRKDTRRGLHDRVLLRDDRGRYLNLWNGRPPAGFRAERIVIGARRDGTPRTAQRIVPDRGGSWELVQLAFERRARGASAVALHADLDLFNTRNGYYQMFSNPIYTGVLEYGDPDNGGLRVEGWIEPCVDAGTWAAVQARVGRLEQGPRLGTTTYTLSGWLRCGACGGALVGNTTTVTRNYTSCTRRYRYRRYGCSRARKGGACEMRQTLHAGRLEAAVYDRIVRDVLTPEALLAMIEGSAPDEGDRLAAEAGVAAKADRVAGIERAIAQITDAIEGCGYQGAALVRRLERREADLALARCELEEARLRLAALAPEVVPEPVLRAFCNNGRAVLATADVGQVRDLLGTIVAEIHAWPDGRGTISYCLSLAGAVGAMAEFCW
jgi:hypothetical protein